MLVLLLLSIFPFQQEARADCLGYEPPDPDCDTTCDQLQAEAKAECEGLRQQGSDTYYIWTPTGCTQTVDGCAKTATGQCKPMIGGQMPETM